MTTTKTEYAYRLKLKEPYDQAVARVTAALKEQGFGVLTEIDVKTTLKEKLDVDFRRYIILGACNPPLAYQALSADIEVGLLLPCNVIVYEEAEGEGSQVAVIDPIAMLSVIEDPALERVAREAKAKLEKVVQALSA